SAYEELRLTRAFSVFSLDRMSYEKPWGRWEDDGTCRSAINFADCSQTESLFKEGEFVPIRQPTWDQYLNMVVQKHAERLEGTAKFIEETEAVRHESPLRASRKRRGWRKFWATAKEAAY